MICVFLFVWFSKYLALTQPQTLDQLPVPSQVLPFFSCYITFTLLEEHAQLYLVSPNPRDHPFHPVQDKVSAMGQGEAIFSPEYEEWERGFRDLLFLKLSSNLYFSSTIAF